MAPKGRNDTFIIDGKKYAPNQIKVLCDGKQVRYVTQLDEEAGWVEHLVYRDGQPVLTADGRAVKTEVLHGIVKVTPLVG